MICIVAFNDAGGTSIAYKKFADNEKEKAIVFYQKQLDNQNVHVISTRKTKGERT